jgi:uncharacterized protein (TIGR02246 family)
MLAARFAGSVSAWEDALDLQKVIDESDIRALAARYSDAVRRCDPVQAAETYAEDGVLMAFSGPEIVGRAAVQEALTRVLPKTNFVMQLCEGGLIEVDGDTAKARWSVTEWIINKENQEVRVSLGVYEDVVVRLPEGWRFKRRRFHPLYGGDPSGGGRVRQDPVMEHTFKRPWGG